MIAAAEAEAKVIQRTGVEASLVVITPAYAQKLLADENRQQNRAVGRRLVEQIKSDILAGRWVENGQAIVLDENDHLMDGQHRLTAIVEADRSVRTLLVRGVHKGAFSTLDCGRKRSAADVLAVNGYTNRANLAAALRWPWAYDNGKWGINAAEQGRLGNTEILAVAKKYPDMGEFVTMTLASKCRMVKRSSVPGIWYICHREKPRIADEFFNGLITGENLDAEQPVYKLRERFIRSVSNSQEFVRDAIVAALIAKAWNAHVTGEPMKRLIYAHGKEEFPSLAFSK